MSISTVSSIWILHYLDTQLFPATIKTKCSLQRDKMQMLHMGWLHREWWHKLCGISMLFLLLGTWESLSALLFTANGHQVVVWAAIASLVSRKKERDAALSFVFSLSPHYHPWLQQPFLSFARAMCFSCYIMNRTIHLNVCCIKFFYHEFKTYIKNGKIKLDIYIKVDLYLEKLYKNVFEHLYDTLQ